MKKKFLILLGIFCVGSIYAQVGVNTKSPLGIFHIDASGNNSAIPTAAQLADDIIVKSDGMGEVGIGIGAIPAKGASVDLISSNKGLQLNVVALTGTDDLLTVPSPVRGMIVYNTTNNSQLYPGICVFNGQTNKWDQMAFTKETFDVKIAISLHDVTTIGATSAVISAGGYDGVSIPFAPLGSTTAGIKITEDGTYAFALNLMGMVNTTETSEVHMYLFMMRKSDMVIMDAAALGTLAMNNPPQYKQSATAILSSILKAGDELDFLICHNIDTPYPWTLFGGAATTFGRYNKTSLSYWKL
ncbi:hypothetical protein G7050_12615 [Dysgonomonas sp. HDW5A]|uniref:hypothetical protein n=1 Tax=unclassified Dysgonomonas TaxID=2630389 RepID=UPI00140B1AC9|nr:MULTISPECIES: hypothetical protein [unclassified Dysgonomonas]QIK55200.1 hypothetical protein G7051_12950 [Dysgonomonas sp. HDW5B]QIK60628.1 hypothetical protein G7050_12615 [Dysgonomonas sp. HDW5A]